MSDVEPISSTPLSQLDWTKRELPKLESSPDLGHDVLAQAVMRAPRGGVWAEFGVAAGTSLARLVTIAATLPVDERPCVVGFDSFKGLPEDWRWNHSQVVPKGTFAQPSIPKIPGAEIVVGMFAETLPKWTKKLKGRPIVFAHIDCDLYSSSRCVLQAIAPYLADGAVIAFDELVGYHGFDAHEWRALYETAELDASFSLEWIGRHACGQQAAILVRRATS